MSEWPRYLGLARLKKHRCDCCGNEWSNKDESGQVLEYLGGALTIRFAGFTYAQPIKRDEIVPVGEWTEPTTRDPNDGNAP